MARAGGQRNSQSPLRRRAEAQLRRRSAPRPTGAADLRHLVHDLEVHQVELEMQNQELLDAQAALSAARDRYASLFDLAPVGYLVLDHDGTIVAANNAACGLFARPHHQVVGRGLATFIALNDRSALAQHLKEATGTDSRTRPLRVTLLGAVMRIVRLETVGDAPAADGRGHYRTTMIDLTDQAQGESQLRAERVALERSQTALRQLARRLMVAEEGQRRRVAADLHDDIAQRLHAIQMEVAILGRRTSTRARSSRPLRTIRRHLEEIIADVEGLARTLHPKIVDDLGLPVALRAHAHSVARRMRRTVQVRERAVPQVIPADVAICLYRVAQEALHNVERHAGTKTATVTLARVGRGLGLCVADRGRGFDPDGPRMARGRLGLVTMKERIGAFNGHFRVRTKPGEGTHVHAWVPIG